MVHSDVRERTNTIVQVLGVPLTITAWTTLSLYMVHIGLRERTYTIVQALGVPLTITAWTTLSPYMVHIDLRERTYTIVQTLGVPLTLMHGLHYLFTWSIVMYESVQTLLYKPWVFH